MRSRHGSRRRFLCRACGRTFCARRGSAYYRLHQPRRTFDRFAELLSEGMSCASLARTLDVSPATISRWLQRASQHARAFADEHDRIRAAWEMQFDEISARPATQPNCPWIFNAIEVSSRYWAAALVGRRSRDSTRAFVLQARQACNLGAQLAITSDPFPFYERELKRGFGPACVYVQVQTSYWPNKIRSSRPTVVIGTEERFREHLMRSEDSRRANTAYIERLNLFLRRSCSYLHRRTSGRVRNPERLASAVEILRCGYNFVRPHASLGWGRAPRTPAMQAGITDRVLTWKDVFAWPVRPPRPAVALARVLASRTRPYWEPSSTVPEPSRVAASGLGMRDLPGVVRLKARHNRAPVGVEASAPSFFSSSGGQDGDPSRGPVPPIGVLGGGVVSHLPEVGEGPWRGRQVGWVAPLCHVPDPLQSRIVSSCPPST